MDAAPDSVQLLAALVALTLMVLSGLGKRRLEWRPPPREPRPRRRPWRRNERHA